MVEKDDAIPSEDTPTNGGTTAVAPHFPTNVGATDWEDESISKFDFNTYDPRKGQTDRLGILTTPVFGRAHYAEGMGYFVCHSTFKTIKGPGGQKTEVCEYLAPCCERLNPSKKRFSVLVAHYTTDLSGTLLKPFGFALKLWRFSEDKYIQLRDMNKELPLASHDLKITGQGDEYKKITISQCKEAVWQSESFQKKYGKDVQMWVEAMTKPQGALPSKVSNSVGRRYAEAEMLKLLGVATQSPTTAPGGDLSTLSVEDLLKG